MSDAREYVVSELAIEPRPTTAEDLRDAVSELRAKGWRLASLSARVLDAGHELQYAFHHAGRGLRVLVVEVAEGGSVPTVSDLAPSLFLEAEAHDLTGVTIEGIDIEPFKPGQTPLAKVPLSGDGVAPITQHETPATVEGSPLRPSVGAGQDGLPIGPQHPILPEPIEIDLVLDGEMVVDAGVRIGHVHRGIEAALQRRDWWKGIPLAERICGICSGIHSYTASRAVEAVAGVTPPDRARALRVCLLELERVHSHLLTIGHLLEAMGLESGFQDAWKVRETTMDLLERLSGNRVNYGFIVPGGVRRDVDEPERLALIDAIAAHDEEVEDLQRRILSDRSIWKRLDQSGQVGLDGVIDLGALGPNGRGSGWASDLRMEDSGGYPVNLRPPFARTDPAGTVGGRLRVRLAELTDSLALAQLALETLPEGETMAKVPRNLPKGQSWVHSEAPRGEVIYHIVGDGTSTPERVKVRTPTLANVPAFLALMPGAHVEDVPSIIASLDPCISCTER